MNRTIPAIFFVILTALSHAQAKQDKSIPFFDIVQADGHHLRSIDLAQGQPVMIVYFDPDCDHCVTFISDLLNKADSFNNSEVVLITYVPLRRLKTYISESGLNKYPQFKTGTEGNKFTVRYHYDVIQFPFVALHDRNWKLFATFESEVPSPDELAKMLNTN
jgi:hypothetical protein